MGIAKSTGDTSGLFPIALFYQRLSRNRDGKNEQPRSIREHLVPTITRLEWLIACRPAIVATISAGGSSAGGSCARAAERTGSCLSPIEEICFGPKSGLSQIAIAHYDEYARLAAGSVPGCLSGVSKGNRPESTRESSGPADALLTRSFVAENGDSIWRQPKLVLAF